MPQKPQKWINKVLSMTSFVTKFIWNFAIYHGKNKDVEKVAHRELQLAYKAVLELAKDVEKKRCVRSIKTSFFL